MRVSKQKRRSHRHVVELKGVGRTPANLRSNEASVPTSIWPMVVVPPIPNSDSEFTDDEEETDTPQSAPPYSLGLPLAHHRVKHFSAFSNYTQSRYYGAHSEEALIDPTGSAAADCGMDIAESITLPVRPLPAAHRPKGSSEIRKSSSAKSQKPRSRRDSMPTTPKSRDTSANKSSSLKSTRFVKRRSTPSSLALDLPTMVAGDWKYQVCTC